MSKSRVSIIVAATMSAGKSTLINALLGRELLHSANEATTATEVRVFGKRHHKYAATCHDSKFRIISSSKKHDSNQLKMWNADKHVHRICIYNGIKSTILGAKAFNMVIIDTPGPNNSQDEKHNKIFTEVLTSHSNSILVYVLNCTQLGVNDDRSLLEKIKSKYNSKNTFFVLNKIDALDPERGEKVSDYVQKAKSYLENSGFFNPVIIPLSAYAGLLARKAINGELLSRREKTKLTIFNEAMKDSDENLVELALVDNEIKEKIRNNHDLLISNCESKYDLNKSELERLFLLSGMATLEYSFKRI